MSKLNPEINQIKPKPGAVLISEPFLPDDNFKRSVIMLTEHNEEGSLGFILNRPLGIRVHEAVEDFPEFEAPLFLGGPVEHNTLHFLHQLGDLIEGSVQVLENLYWGGNFEELKMGIINGDIMPDDVRFFLGYSGWGPDQLDMELAERSWIVTNGISKYVFGIETDNLWQEVLKNMGGQYQLMSTFPESPLLN